ncbi:MAG: glycosyltransferase family 4 protein [Deltaproteobacteria bacterium]|nr:glycosyltransferase family 4 protein [Deltaproteobacteria bacterium]
MMTWEFPPFIAGGLGTACYGLARALLCKGIEIDLMLPTAYPAIFPLRNPDDVDSLQARPLSAEVIFPETFSEQTLATRLMWLGLSYESGAYGFSNRRLHHHMSERFHHLTSHTSPSDLLQVLIQSLQGDELLFKQVLAFTQMVYAHVAENDYDLIHAHDWLTYPAALLLQSRSHCPVIAHIHATEFDRAAGPGDHRIHEIEYAGLTLANRVISVSQYTKQMIVNRYAVDPNKVETVHNAYSMDEEEKKKHRIFKDPVVLFMGRITLQKGPDYFLKIAERVIKQFPRVRFLMAGTGDMFSRILQQGASLRLKDRFLCLGFLGREEVKRLLDATDIYVMPSVSEPFGIAPLEAMASGAVAIISKHAGAAEILENVYKVDFWDIERTSDIILELLHHPSRRAALAKAGEHEVADIQWNEAADKIIQVYERVACST